MMSAMPPSPSMGFEVELKYPIVAFVLGLCSVYIVINGTKMKAQWGGQFYPAAPGRYTITCFTHYLFFSEMGKNSVVLDLYPGQIIRLTWVAPTIAFLKGPIRWEVLAGPNTGFSAYIP